MLRNFFWGALFCVYCCACSQPSQPEEKKAPDLEENQSEENEEEYLDEEEKRRRDSLRNRDMLTMSKAACFVGLTHGSHKFHLLAFTTGSELNYVYPIKGSYLKRALNF